MDVVVEVGDWEHECCGSAIERDQLVDFRCTRSTGHGGQVHLVETHHDTGVEPEDRVQGRVVDIRLVHAGGAPEVCLPPMTRCSRSWDHSSEGGVRSPWPTSPDHPGHAAPWRR